MNVWLAIIFALMAIALMAKALIIIALMAKALIIIALMAIALMIFALLTNALIILALMANALIIFAPLGVNRMNVCIYVIGMYKCICGSIQYIRRYVSMYDLCLICMYVSIYCSCTNVCNMYTWSVYLICVRRYVYAIII